MQVLVTVRKIFPILFASILLLNDSFLEAKNHPSIKHDTVFKRVDQNIDSVKFLGSVHVDSIVRRMYSSSLYWGADTFVKDVDLSGARFMNAPDFSYSVFNGGFSMRDCSVNWFHINFTGVKFSRFACFRNMALTGDNPDYVFDNAVLPDTLDFSHNPRIKFDIDLTAANTISNYKKTRYIFLYKTDISKFHIGYQLTKLLFVDPITHYVLSPDEKSFIYEELLKNFKDRGQFHDFEMLNFDYQRFLWSLKPWYYRWPGFIIELLDGYGYDNARIFTWIIGLLLLFTIINYFLLDKLNESYTLENMLLVYKPRKFKGHMINLWYSLIYTSIVFFHPVIKLERLKYHNIAITLYLIFIYTVGLILVGFAIHTILT